MSGSKAPDFDAYGLFRATHSHNPTQYSHIAGIIPLLCSYWGGSQGLSPTYEQAHVGLDLLTLASQYFDKHEKVLRKETSYEKSTIN